MANGLLDYLSGFGTTPPEYLGGLLGQEAVDKLKGRAATTGIANAVLGYLAAPKNQNLGLGRIIGQSLQAGMTGAQGVYDTATQDYLTQQKIAEIQRQNKQRTAFDTAAESLYKTTPAQYATEQVSGGGYLPQTPDVNAVAPNFGLSKTYAPATTQQVMTAPEKQEMSPTALNAMLLSGDPRATAYLTGLETIKKLQTPAKADLVKAGIGEPIYDPNTKSWILNPVAKPEEGTADYKNYQVYQRDEQARGRAPLSFNDWNLQTKAAGASRLTNINKGEGKYEETLGAGLANRDLALINTADTAPKQLSTAQSIKALLKQNPIVGTGADSLLALNGLLTTAGLIDPSKQITTELLSSDLASQTLANIKSSGLGAGQGFTNSDREFLAKATAGSLTMNAASLQRLADLSERSATLAIGKYNDFYERTDKDKRKFYGLTPIVISTPKPRFK
jgi:hypothetical protein